MSILPLLKSFEKERGWVRYQIDSFNKFVDSGVKEILSEIGIIKLATESTDLQLKFGKVTIEKPTIREADGSIGTILS